MRVLVWIDIGNFLLLSCLALVLLHFLSHVLASTWKKYQLNLGFQNQDQVAFIENVNPCKNQAETDNAG